MNVYLKIQKVLRFIPYVNMFILFTWYFTMLYKRVSQKEARIKSFQVILFLVATTIPRLVIGITLQNTLIDTIAYHVTVIIQFYFASSFLVKHQEEVLNREKED